ncbi:MAG: SPASM domain-containing protein [Oscillospiraceae bacterium]|nr:SPASM domain-containing protein [Oscillospiraceae bacterium]
MKRFRKIYLEISNICNFKCSFCPGTKRQLHAMTEDEFQNLAVKLIPWTDYLYFHLMGEPLCHPKLDSLLQIAKDIGFKVIITTNGSLLSKCQNTLLTSNSLHKVNISLHAFEANDLNVPFSQYLEDCFSFGASAKGQKIICYRLWNQGGSDAKNSEILDKMEHHFPKPWVTEQHGIRIADRVYLEYGDKFDWPDLNATDNGEQCFCYGLRDQIGVLCDGTVVPCCLDHEGDIPLGNLFEQELGDILESPRAKAIYTGFSEGKAMEQLCRRCGYAQRFRK